MESCGKVLRLVFVSVGILALGGWVTEAVGAPMSGPGGAPSVGPRKGLIPEPGTGAARKWQVFESKAGLFSVEFPAKPTRRREEGALMFVAEVDGGAYLLSYTDLPKDHGTPNVIFDEVQKTAFGDGAKVLKSEDKTLEGGHPGRALVVQDAEKDFYITRLYVVKDRMYQVMCVVPPAAKDSPDVTRFLDSFKLLDPAKIQAEKPKKPETGEQTPDSAAKTPDPQPPEGADDLTSALVGLKSGDHGKVKAAAERLAKMEPVKDRREEVAKALAAALANENGFTRSSALKALGVWYVPAVLPDMVKCLQDESGFVRGFAFDALADTKSPQAAEAIAARLADDRGNASKALKAMGPMAEPIVLKRLKDADPKVRAEAVKVLGEIGTAKSLAALRPLTTDKDLGTRVAAERAVKAIEGRR